MLQCKIAEYQQQIVLLDGSTARLRLIKPEDKEAIRSFYNRLSPETRFLRYQYAKADLTEEDLKNFCEVDYWNTLALVAEKDAAGRSQIVAVGRYCRLPDGRSAEVAFVVQDDEQGKGIGTQLLKHLAILAWENNIYYFVGEVLRINGRMLSIFRKSDPGMDYRIDDHTTCTICLSVPEAMWRTPSAPVVKN
ncbi:MAG: GNAT family N-acetyltransferase [Dehalococcoidales bacterium]|jgi:GNAT superfamily N-acetyltransferase|nr:GNAT family N-acetyltransferase [Dehalococcoidales bacterium]